MPLERGLRNQLTEQSPRDTSGGPGNKERKPSLLFGRSSFVAYYVDAIENVPLQTLRPG